MKILATNRKANFEYHIISTYEAGIVLVGSEVKSVRLGNVNLKDSFIVFDKKGECFVKNMHISEYKEASLDKVDEKRSRKLLLNKTEINKLLKAVEHNPNKVIAARDKALFSLAIATGMRASAIVNINKEDIIWDDNIIKVIEKRQKVREIPIGENIMGVLKEWISVRDIAFGDFDGTALFISQKNGRLSPDAANDALKKYCSEAGIQKKITLHKLRSSAATSLAAAKVDIQTIGNILGHRSTATTLRYVAVLDENKKNAVGILDNLV